MNTNGVAKEYHKLTPWERLPLTMGAAFRGDNAEFDRLARSAPRHRWELPDHYGLGEGLQVEVAEHVMNQLNRAVIFWQASALLESALLEEKIWESKIAKRIWAPLRMLAYRIVTHADGWKLFCEGLRLDPDKILSLMPGYDTMKQAEQACRAGMAYTPEEALKCLRGMLEAKEQAAGQAPVDVHIPTALDVAKDMREGLERALEKWS